MSPRLRRKARRTAASERRDQRLNVRGGPDEADGSITGGLDVAVTDRGQDVNLSRTRQRRV